MSLTKQLHDLKKQKREAVKDLHVTYLHTKRDLKRTLSPDRAIRRHLGVAMGVAALAGLMLAPAPKYRARGEKAEKTAERARKRAQKLKSKSSMLPSWLIALIRKFVPQLAAYLPDPTAAADPAKGADEAVAMGEQEQERAEKEHDKHQDRTRLRPILLELAMLVLQRVDIQKIVAQLMHAMSAPKRSSGNHHPDEEAEGPAVSVADVGTIPPPVN